MSLKNGIELENTQRKLARLERRFETLRQEPCEDAHVRELTLRSLKQMINQFKEEIVRYRSAQAARGQPLTR
ncbi:MAG: hypothetical protein C4547_09205 [Phycisphaerales bacterium]|nr:MAG: hypothetical protein C4547_09205 [Phycisphaerales bacterium]